MGTDQLRPTHDASLISEVEAWIERFMTPTGDLRLSSASAVHWVVVPVESGLHFSEDDVRQFVKAMDVEQLLAVPTEHLDNLEPALVVPVSKAALMAFSRRWGYINCVLIPHDQSFAIVCTVYDYYLVAGPRTVAESILGCSVEAARSRFKAYSEAAEPTSDYGHVLHEVAERYSASVFDS